MCTDVGVCVCVPSILMLSVSRMANDSLFSLPHHLFSLIFFSLLLFVTVPPPPIPSLPCLFLFYFSLSPSLYLTSSSPSSPDRQSEYKRSNLASPLWPSSSLVSQCSVHSGGKTDGTRRQRETGTKRKNQRGRQRERRSDAQGKHSCKGLALI